jgi:hypothetical protein
MDSNSFRLFSGAAGISSEPAIGDFVNGGYFGGYISLNANGVATHRLIVSPKSSGEISTVWQSFPQTQTNADSSFNGVTNTALMTPRSPAGDWARALSINGFTDWYVPSIWENEIVYVNLKPSTTTNGTGWTGQNNYSVPKRTAANPANPTQTTVTLFKAGQSQAITESRMWVSSEDPSNPVNFAQMFSYSDGQIDIGGIYKANTRAIRAFRRVPV